MSAQKFLGNIYQNSTPPYFTQYWNQVTPENSGKWDACEPSRDNYNWGGMDNAYSYANQNGYPFKGHTLVWGNQEPGWIGQISQSEQRAEVEEWIRDYFQRYPGTDYIDVVNEPLHAPASYRNALGGSGSTGWDWVITSFELARQYAPAGCKLLINEYGIISNPTEANNYVNIINLLNDRGLVDGIGIQCHAFNMDNVTTGTMNQVLNILASTGLPIYVSELDIRGDDNTQLQRYQQKFPIFWEHPSVQGVTLWGYLQGVMWQEEAWLLTSGGSPRPALQWLMDYVSQNNPDGNENIWLEAECGEVGSSWNVVDDGAASNDQYVTVQSGNNSTESAPSGAGQITYQFAVEEGGTYALWSRAITPSPTDDSFWIRMDGGSWFMWNNIGPNSTWAWEQAQTYSLNPGDHTLTIAYREDGALLDKILITNTGTIPSGEGSAATNCSAPCDPTPIVPYISVNGAAFQQISNVTVNSGDQVILGPQPVNGGSWSWTGCGTAGTSREQIIYPTSSCTATATYTNSCGTQSTQSFTITVNPYNGSNIVWLEAECGNVGSQWNIASDGNASNDQYVSIQSGNNSTGSAPGSSSGHITYTFEVSESGTYTLWARVIAPTPNDDSYWVQMDGGSWLNWNGIASGSTTWTWDDVDSYSLSAGTHTLTIGYREDGTQLDKLYLSNTGETPTGEGGEASGCDNDLPDPINPNPSWSVTARIFEDGPSGSFDAVSVKDPSIVYNNGQYHLFFTGRDANSWRMGYASAPSLYALGSATRHYMGALNAGSYFCAPQVFWFGEKGKWFLIYQSGLGASFSTNTDINNPDGWTANRAMGFTDGIDFWCISDGSMVYCFYSAQDGSRTIKRRSTTIADFPYNWSSPTTVATNTFEAPHVYKNLEDGKYYMIVEDIARHQELWVANNPGGTWTKIEEEWAAGNDITFLADHWTDQISHCEVIRAGSNELLEVEDLNNCQLIFQGVVNGDYGSYGNIPYDLGIASNGSTIPDDDYSITVRALGVDGSEQITLNVGGAGVQTWTLGTVMNSYTASTTLTGPISIEFINDDGTVRDVQIDYISVEGAVWQAEDQSTNTGVWQDGSCGGSNSEWLHCGGYIQFGAFKNSVGEKEMLSDAAKEENLLLYPNPASEMLTIEITGKLHPGARVEIYSSKGELISSQSVEESLSFVNINSYPAGMYIIQLQNGKVFNSEIFTKK